MYFDLPFCVKSVKRVKENVGNPLRTIGYAFKEVKLQLIFRAIILPPFMHFWMFFTRREGQNTRQNEHFYFDFPFKLQLIKFSCNLTF